MKFSTSAFSDQTVLSRNIKKQSNYFKTHVVDVFQVANTSHLAVIPDGLYKKIQNTENTIQDGQSIENTLDDCEYFKKIDLSVLDDSYFSQYFPFILDPFQRISCQSIQYGHNVLVCAHTASGKTLVAEYAIHQAIKQNKKIIYTSPIKALSNQKYHELSNKFESVGLLTGDTTLNPTADILVMTTEILRNMLYKQNINAFYLIFDEIHYMTDRERGVVWEECIIFSTSPCIFLSATVENAEEFASWVSVTQNRVTNIVYNEKRIVPLVHYVYPVGGNGLHRIKGKSSAGQAEPKNVEKRRLADDSVDNQETVHLSKDKLNENEEVQESDSSSILSDQVPGGDDSGNDSESKRKSKKKKNKKPKEDTRNKKKTNLKPSERKVKKSGSDEKPKKVTQKPSKITDNNKTRQDISKKVTKTTEEKMTKSLKKVSKTRTESKSKSSKKKSTNRFKKDKKEHPVEQQPQNQQKAKSKPRARLSASEKLKKESLKVFQNLPNKSEEFNIDNFNDAIANIRRNRLDLSDISNIIDLLEQKNLLPLIVFSFRRKDCEKYATSLDKDYTTDEEKEQITTVFNNAINTLDQADREMMPIKSLLPLLLRGIGIHHSGLLSILKETQEILFSLNLLKILFATETFSIGLNMPAKSIIFSTVFKFDGTQTRPISSGEYIQMSGRAGRRGLDKEGICISILSESINIQTALQLYNGRSNPIRSAFHLTYNMILNIIAKDKDPVFLLKRSFFHFQKMRSIQNLSDEAEEIFNKIDLVNEHIQTLREKSSEISSEQIEKPFLGSMPLNTQFTGYSPTYELNPEILHKGRVVDCLIKSNGMTLYLKNCVIGHIDRLYNLTKSGINEDLTDPTLQINQADQTEDNENFSELHKNTIEIIVPLKNTLKRKLVSISSIYSVYDARVKISSKLFSQLSSANLPLLFHKYDKSIQMSYCELCGDQAEADCIEETCFERIFTANINSQDEDEKSSSENPEDSLPKMRRLKSYLSALHRSKSAVLAVRSKIDHIDQCEKMIAVLRRLGYISNGKITLKGRVACELSTSELILTELMFSGQLSSLSVTDIVSLLSSLVFEETGETNLTEESEQLHEILKKQIDDIQFVCDEVEKGTVSQSDANSTAGENSSNVSSSGGKSNKKVEKGGTMNLKSTILNERAFSNELMDVVRLWCDGATFETLTRSTSFFEGSVVRCLKRLEELLRQLAAAARAIGNNEMERIFCEGIGKIKRGVVFSNSLYL